MPDVRAGTFGKAVRDRRHTLLTLSSWGLRPFFEYKLDPATWDHSARPLPSPPRTYDGYAGSAQELCVNGRGTILLAVFVHDGDLVLLLGKETLSLFTPGLKLEHRRGKLFSNFRVTTPDGNASEFVYRRPDLLMAIIDTTYDDLDLESVHLAAALPSLAARDPAELLAEWSARAAAPLSPPETNGEPRNGS